ncbi:MAG: monooxygenase, partial [Nocardioides sp.]|nr:monooxygenase [Nocardioides sp.]
MYVTWFHLQSPPSTPSVPWLPSGASFVQSGQGAGARAVFPSFDGTSWCVLAVFDTLDAAMAAQPGPDDTTEWWRVVLQPVSFHGDGVLSGGVQPFEDVARRGKVAGAAVVITMAGTGPDPARTSEFLERFPVLGDDVESARGFRAALVQAPEDGAVLTFSAWRTLRDAVTWAYHSPRHAETVQRHQDHPLLESSGFLRSAVLHSTG